FVKKDCPTCETVLPLLGAWQRAFGAALPFLVVGQSGADNALLQEKMGGGAMLDDADLTVSFRWDVEIVPTLVVTDAQGGRRRTLVGFVREEWQAFVAGLAGELGVPEPEWDWAALPAWQPGCGSASADPLVAERLRAVAENSPLRARRIEIGAQDDEHEFLFDQGLTDGLPVVPPTPERVLRMLAGTDRDPQEVVAVVPPNLAEATVEKVAINAVMAGCRP